MISPPPPLSPGPFSEGQISRFHEGGYLMVPGLLSGEEVQAATDAFAEILALHANGSTGAVWHLPPAGRGEAVLKSPGSRFSIHTEPNWDPTGRELAVIDGHVRKYWGFSDEHPFFQSLLNAQHHRLYQSVVALLGEGAVLFQEMALVKPPFVGREKPWHQDNAYFAVTPLDQILGVWIALDPADATNGCMHLLPGGHRLGGFKHGHRTDCEIVSPRFDPSNAVAIPVAAGDALFFYGMLPHQTPPNRSERRRRAMQFHYRGAATEQLEAEDYDRHFAEPDGTPASCAAFHREARG